KGPMRAMPSHIAALVHGLPRSSPITDALDQSAGRHQPQGHAIDRDLITYQPRMSLSLSNAHEVRRSAARYALIPSSLAAVSPSIAARSASARPGVPRM